MARKRPKNKDDASSTPPPDGDKRAKSTPPSAPESRSERRQRERKERGERSKAETKPRLSGDWPHLFVRLGLLLGAMAIIAAVRVQPMFSERLEQRADLRYQASDGKEYPYLIGQDSYSWVRKARNYLEKGTPCDAIVEGQCRDELRHAPVGSVMPYADSLHIQAIGWLHRAIKLVRPQTPLEVSAFFLQVLVGALGAIPAWFLGMRMGGAFGGFASALLVGLHEDFFQRSLGADNDPWNIVLPMCAVLAILHAIERRVLWQRVAWATIGGLAIGLHADMWSGFGLGFLVVFVATLGFMVWTASRLWIVAERPAIKRELLALSLVLSSFTGATFALSHEYHDEWNEIASQLQLPRPWPDPPKDKPSRARARVLLDRERLPVTFPNGLQNVGELRQIKDDALVARFGGRSMVFGSFMGLFVLLLPFAAWSTFEWGLLVLTTLLVGGAAFTGASVWVVAACAALPASVLVGSRVLTRKPVPLAPIAGAVLLAVWLFATVKLTGGGQRFILLAVPPLGLTLGCGAGHFIHYVRRNTRQPLIAWALALGLVAGVYGLSQKGVAYAKNALPDLNDTWWDSMTKLRETSPKDSIVHAWWPYGYWVEYIAQRGVTADGSSALKRITHWTGRALMASSEREALGLFRMLSCGSDSNGDPEERRGAFYRIRDAGTTSYVAHDVILRLASMSRVEAERFLLEFPWSEEDRSKILEATHCKARPSYLVLSDKQTRQSDLRYQGNWDLRRASIGRTIRDMPDNQALGYMLRELGMKGQEAVDALFKARAAKTDAQLDHYVAPAWPPYFSTQCEKTGERRTCKIMMRPGQTSPFEAFTYYEAQPERGVFTYKKGDSLKGEPPHTLVVVRNGEQQTYRVAESNAKDYSVLLDTQSGRVLVASSSLIRSVFTRLMFLRNYQVNGFERVDDRSGGGERVVTFRLNLPED